MSNSVEISEALATFLQFTCDHQHLSADQLFASTRLLITECPSTREPVLQLYGQLFDEYCLHYVTHGKDQLFTSTSSVIYRLKEPIRKIVQPPLARRKSSEERKSISAGGDEDTPASPTPIAEPDTDDDTMDTEVDQMEDLEKLIQDIGNVLLEMTVAFKLETAGSSKVGSWALNLLPAICANNFGKRAIVDVRSSQPLADTIAYWTKCLSLSILLEIVVKALEEPSTDEELQGVMLALIKHSPYTDWACAVTITTMSAKLDEHKSSFSNCIETLVKSSAQPQSIKCILSHLSEQNPRAIINSSKNNIPFLLQLCASSKPLLNLLSEEMTKQVDINKLNSLSLELDDEMIRNVLYCAMNAPNAYRLLSIGFEVVVDDKTSPKVKNQTLRILYAIVNQLHDYVHGSAVQLKFPMPIMDILKANSDDLVTEQLVNATGSLKKLQLRLLNVLCVHYKKSFASELLHTLLCTFSSTESSSVMAQVPHPVLTNFLKSQKLHFGSEAYKMFLDVLSLDKVKNETYWTNVCSLIESEDGFEIDVDLITEHFIKEYNEVEDVSETLHHILKLMIICLEKFPKQLSKPKHQLCLTLVSFYVHLVKDQEVYREEDTKLDLKMRLIVMTQKTMSTFAKKQVTNQHILCRALVEAIVSLNTETHRTAFAINHLDISLKDENIKYGGLNSAYQFRKMPLNPFKRTILDKDRAKKTIVSNMTSQLLLDGLKSCIVDIAAFAYLLVECVTPDVMFNDLPWPDEDFLKVTIERDLYISRIFDQQPLLWDLCELIGAGGFLMNCAVLVRALMAVQLTQWASATVSNGNVETTQRLLKLITNGGLIPQTPFKCLPQVLPKLSSWEIFCVLNDIWRYMKDNSSSATSGRLAPMPIRPYLERLRVIMVQHMPGPLYVKIFKGLV
ncbi:Integrator complex subunit 5 [Halotydeus destructor]|nr:Integrator complex subunit 5 [Halotydeus destructor]